jgi:hypothetical protein
MVYATCSRKSLLPEICPKSTDVTSTVFVNRGAITFPVMVNDQEGQMTAVAIRSENEDTFWTITAAGTGKAAELADKTAREFTFK